jgi:hypothetical protein
MRCLGMVKLLGMDPTAAQRNEWAGQGGVRVVLMSRSNGDGNAGGGASALSYTEPATCHPARGMRPPGQWAWPAAWRQHGVLTWQRSTARLHRVQQVPRKGGHLDLGEASQLQKKGWARDIYF